MIDLDFTELKNLKLSHEKSGYVWDDTMQMSAHRACAVRLLGRTLVSTEHVHHINHKKGDNRPANLMVLAVGIHDLLHAASSNYYFATQWGDMKDTEKLLSFFRATGVPYIWLGDFKEATDVDSNQSDTEASE